MDVTKQLLIFYFALFSLELWMLNYLMLMKYKMKMDKSARFKDGSLSIKVAIVAGKFIINKGILINSNFFLLYFEDDETRDRVGVKSGESSCHGARVDKMFMVMIKV